MATPKPTNPKSGRKQTPTPDFETLMLDPETDEFEEADVFGKEFSEITGEWYDPEIETAETATGTLAHYDH